MQDSKELKNEDTKVEENKSEKKRKLLRWLEILCFCILILVVTSILSYVMNPLRLNMPTAVSERDQIVSLATLEEKNSIDVFILGDSEARVLACPEILMEKQGISAYVGSQSGQKISELYVFLRDIIEEQDPKVVIIETDLFVLDGTSVMIEGGQAIKTTSEDIFPIFRYHNSWRYMWGLQDPPETNFKKGFKIVHDIEPYNGGEYMEDDGSTYGINFVVKYYMNKVKKLCDENDIQIVFVSSPSPENMTYAKHKVLQDYSEELGIPFIDFNDENSTGVHMDWDLDTLDGGDHINYNGSIKVSEYLADYLTENYNLPDRRKE